MGEMIVIVWYESDQSSMVRCDPDPSLTIFPAWRKWSVIA
jgi:hypothetical protein